MSKQWWSNVKKLSGNELAQAAADGVVAGDSSGFLDSGCYSLNALISGSIYGGYPTGKITAVAGPESSGKSFLVLQATKLFLDKNPDGAVFYFESESAMSKKMIESRGIDSSRMIILPVVTLQEFRTQAVKILDAYIESEKDPKNRPPMLFILDSLGNLSTSKEIEDTAAGSETRDMTRAQIAKAAFRVLTLKLGAANVPLLVTNHIYASMSTYAPAEMSGGSGLKYAGSTILFLSKRKLAEGTERIGNDIRIKAMKSRFTIENSEVVAALKYESGLDRYYGLVEIALASGVFQKDGTRILLPDGRKVFQTTINRNPEDYFTKEILDAIDAACPKVFCYGQGSAEELPASDSIDDLDDLKEMADD